MMYKKKFMNWRRMKKNPMAKSIYETMQHNMDLAAQLNRPSCQDTGVLQFWVRLDLIIHY